MSTVFPPGPMVGRRSALSFAFNERTPQLVARPFRRVRLNGAAANSGYMPSKRNNNRQRAVHGCCEGLVCPTAGVATRRAATGAAG